MYPIGAKRVYLLYCLLSALFFGLYATYNMVYYATTVDLNALQLVLIGTVLETTAFLCEVPTGIVADLYSRKLSIIIGHVLIGVGFMVSAVPDFGVILLSQVIWGLGWTFTSGATGAWITDEVGEAQVGPLFMRGSQAGSIGGLVGVLAGTALATFGLHVPLFAGGALNVGLALLLLAIMPETGFRPTPRAARNTFGHMAATFREGLRAVRGRQVLVLLISVSFFWGMASEGYDRLWQKLLVDNFTLPAIGTLDPVTWFGAFSIAGALISIGATELLHRRIDTTNGRALARALLLISVGLIASLLMFALAGSFPLAVAALLLVGMFRSLNGPLFDTWVNQQIDSRVRATVLSMMSQVDAVGQIAGGPVVGFIGLRGSVRAAVVTASLLMSPILLLYGRALRRGQPVEEVAVP